MTKDGMRAALGELCLALPSLVPDALTGNDRVKHLVTLVPPNAASGGVVSLEVRWIHAGRLPEPLVERLEPFREGTEVREDWYLTDPVLPELSVKIRGGGELDVKALRGRAGRLSLPGGTRGELELWEKWSFPLTGEQRLAPETAAWTRVVKARRRRSFAVVGDRLVERPLAQAAAPGCTIEVTEFAIDGGGSWTLGLEAVGPLEALCRDLQATARTLLDDRLCARFGLDLGGSTSYQRLLQTQAHPHVSAHGGTR